MDATLPVVISRTCVKPSLRSDSAMNGCADICLLFEIECVRWRSNLKLEVEYSRTVHKRPLACTSRLGHAAAGQVGSSHLRR